MADLFSNLKAQFPKPWKVHNVWADGGTTKGGTPRYPPVGINPTEPPTNAAEGGAYFDDDTHTLMVYNGTSWVTAGSVGAADALTVNGVIVPAIQYAHFRVGPHATVTEYDLMIAERALTVVSISAVPSTLQGGALTATICKCTGTAAPANGTTPMHTANAINLNSGAYTVQTITLTATAADLTLAADERIGIDYSAALTAGHAVVTIGFKYV
jgi:hypothetical protein